VRRARGWRSRLSGLLPDALAQKVMERAGVDRLAALYSAIASSAAVARFRSAACTAGWPTRCRCFNCSTSRSRCGWGSQRLELGAGDSSAAGPTRTRWESTGSPPTPCPLAQAAQAYEMFQKKSDGAVKIVFEP